MKKILVIGALSVAANTNGTPAYQVEQQVSELIAYEPQYTIKSQHEEKNWVGLKR